LAGIKGAGIKGILFDKDGTLVDFNSTWFGIAHLMAMEAAEGDRGRADELLLVAGLDFAAGRFKPDSIFAAGTNMDIVELWFPHLPAVAQKEALARFDRITAEQGAAMAVPLPGMAQTLAALHSTPYRLGLATNDSTAGAERTLAALGFAQLFDAAYGYDAVANPKPAPDTIVAFCDLTGLKPSEIAWWATTATIWRWRAPAVRPGGRRALGHRHARVAGADGRCRAGLGGRSARLSGRPAIAVRSRAGRSHAM